MLELTFWKIEQGNEDLAKRIKQGFDRLYDCPPRGYKFNLSDEHTNFSEKGKIYFVVGKDLDHLLGYACCQEGNPSKNIGEISNLDGLDSEGFLEDYNGNPVSRETLSDYDGFRNYSGQGKVLCIGIIETFVRNQGIGTRLLDYIKGNNYELIEVEANGHNPVNFFESNGFLDSGIDADDDMMVMVWNNPVYT